MNGDINYVSIVRDYAAEYMLSLSSRINYAFAEDGQTLYPEICSCRVENNSEIIFNNTIMVQLNVPSCQGAFPLQEGIFTIERACAPRVTQLDGIQFGRNETHKLDFVETQLFPYIGLCEFVASGNIFASSWNMETDKIVSQIANTIGLQNRWGDLKETGQRWSIVKHEYDFYSRRDGKRSLVPFYDESGNLENLMQVMEYGNSTVLLPLAFVGNASEFGTGMTCYFSAKKEWPFLNSEYLRHYPEAEVWISNDYAFVLSNPPTEYRIVLGYFLGVEMIAYFNLEILRGRRIVLPIHGNEDECQGWKRSLKETSILFSRFRELKIKATCVLIHKKGLSLSMHQDTGLGFSIRVVNYGMTVPEECPETRLSALLYKNKLGVPMNLRSDRFGAINITEYGTSLISGFASRGGLTFIAIHEGGDLSLLTSCMVVSMLKNTSIFPNHWEISASDKLTPICLIPHLEIRRYGSLIPENLRKSLCFYKIPEGTEEEIKKVLNGALDDTSANIVLIAGRELQKRYANLLKVLMELCVRDNFCLVVISNEEPQGEAADCREKEFHFWHNQDGSYFVEDRAPLTRAATNAFGLKFEEGKCCDYLVSETELQDIKGRVNIRRENDTNTKNFQDHDMEEFCNDL